MLTKEEYEKEYIRMMDCERTDHKGSFSCIGVKCYDCPFSNVCGVRPEYIYDLLEIVEHWSKNHPVVTNADKFKKVFGVEPRTPSGDYFCPPKFLDNKTCCDYSKCDVCEKAFWEAEYKAPEERSDK